MIYERKLLDLLSKYGIDIIDESKLNDNYEGIIIDAITRKCKNKTCALWGAGQNNTKSSHAAILITKYATFIQNMVCVIDSNAELQGKSFLGYPIISPAQMKDFGIDIVIIASKNSGESIKKNLFDINPKYNYIDIYEELRDRGIEVYNNFYDESSIYTKIFDVQEQYHSDKDEKSLSKLISLYFSIRDFYYAEKYMEEYIELKFFDYHKYKNLQTDIHKLFQEIKENNRNRKNDLSLFYIDALRAKEVFDESSGKSKVFNRYTLYGKSFTNIYSTAVTTYESMMSVITGKYPLEENVYTDDFLHEIKDFELLSDYIHKDFDINFLVSDCYKIIKDNKRINFYMQNYMPQKLWTLTCKLAEVNNDTFNFVYFPYEIHFPLLSGYHKERPVIRAFSDLGINEFPSSMARQYEECIDYTNKQFDFYYELIGQNTTKVIFSDHSQVVYDENNNNKTYNMYYKWKEKTTHVPLIISKEGWLEEIDTAFYSMIDFNKIINAVLTGSDTGSLKKDIIRYQYYPMHNPKMREHAMEYGFTDYIDGLDIFMSMEYVYVQTATGVSEVYRCDDLEHNLSHTETGKHFIQLVKSKFHVAFNV